MMVFMFLGSEDVVRIRAFACRLIIVSRVAGVVDPRQRPAAHELPRGLSNEVRLRLRVNFRIERLGAPKFSDAPISSRRSWSTQREVSSGLAVELLRGAALPHGSLQRYVQQGT